MTTLRFSKWLRALLRPAPILGMAMIAVLVDRARSICWRTITARWPSRRAREPIFLPIVVMLTLLELIIMVASIRRQMSLEQINMRFNTALENMTHGLCMFDGNKRLVICNDRYASLYRLPPELLKAGTTHQAIIGHRVMNGLLKGEQSAGAVDKSSGRWANTHPSAFRAASTSWPMGTWSASPGSR